MGMYSGLLSIFFVCFSSSSLLAQETFKDYCESYKRDKKSVTVGLGLTVKALYEKSGQESCSKAFDFLKKLRSLNLSGLSLTSLVPLNGISNLESLDVSYNNLTDLWGLENLIKLEHLIANHNKIRNITPVVYMKNLSLVNLNENELEFVSPLKELLKLKHYHLDDNPISYKSLENEEENEIGFLNGMIYMRGSFGAELDYDLSLEDSEEDFFDSLNRIAQRGDFVFYRKLLDSDKVFTRITEDPFYLLLAEPKLKKMILGVKCSEDIAIHLIKNYKKITGEEKGLDFYWEKRKQLAKFLEFYLAEGDRAPYLEQEVESLEKFLLEQMEKNPTLDPRVLETEIKTWEGTRSV